MANPYTGEIYELAEGEKPTEGDLGLTQIQVDSLLPLKPQDRIPELQHLLERQKNQQREHQLICQHDKVLVATVGLPRSGKTTWAKMQAYPIVNPDAIRLALHGQRFIAEAEPYVWAIAKTMVKALFLAGHKVVVLDATNNTVKRRQEWVSKEWATYFKHIDTSAQVCIERADEEDDHDIMPVIERMASQYEPLTDDEKRWL